MFTRIRPLYILIVVLLFILLNVYLYTVLPAEQWATRGCPKERVSDIEDLSENYGSLRKDILTSNLKTYDNLLCIFVILSGPSNFPQRKSIRSTWKEEIPQNCKGFFVIGTKNLAFSDIEQLNTENREFGDLMLLKDLVDSYRNLTEKLLLSFLYASLCCKFQLLVKVDDDVYVDMVRFKSELEARRNRRSLYWGYFAGDARVKYSGPWSEHEFHLCDRYLPYARGGGYVLSYDLVQFVFKNHKMLKMYKSEDVSVGTWLAPLDITWEHDVRFDTEAISRGCLNEFIITHKVSPEKMLETHQTLKSSAKLCEREFTVKQSYQYNLKVPPSKCCGKNLNM